MCSECSRGAYDADKIVRPCNGQHRYIWDSKREFRFCESCFEPEPPDRMHAALAAHFAAYQATPVVIATPPILVGKRIAEKGF